MSIKNPLTGGYLEVDVWYPGLKICFEYQVFLSISLCSSLLTGYCRMTTITSLHGTHKSHLMLCRKRTVSDIKQYTSILNDLKDIKRSQLLQKGQTLIPVPCWWDGTAERYEYLFNSNIFQVFVYMFFFNISLRATIKFYRPDLLQLQPMHSVSIPTNPPLHFFSGKI